MNVVIIGGGEPGKFGNDFALRMRSEGHNVYIVSHRNHYTKNPHEIHANFNSLENVVNAFNIVTKDVETIDMILFNSNAGSYPCDETDFKSSTEIDFDKWNYTVQLACHVPHILTVEALKRMHKGSKIIFMISYMALEFNRTEWTSYAGYAGTKAMQAHMMKAFAHHNDKEAIATAIAPHFMYNVPENYKQVFELVYNYIIDSSETDNGSIMFVDAFTNPPFMDRYDGQ